MGAALGLPVGVAAALATWLLGGDHTVGLVLATAAAAWVASQTTVAAALVATLQCWACFDGFVLHRLGSLESGPADVAALALIAAAALATRTASRGRRASGSGRLRGVATAE